MENETALILKGFCDEMGDDLVGWTPTTIGREAYHLFRLLEHTEDIS